LGSDVADLEEPSTVALGVVMGLTRSPGIGFLLREEATGHVQ
jgi:hypothetical protein